MLQDSLTVDLIRRSIYVDDISYGADTVEDAYLALPKAEMLVMGGRFQFAKNHFQLM